MKKNKTIYLIVAILMFFVFALNVNADLDFTYFEEEFNICAKSGIVKSFQLIGYLLTTIKIIVPIILIVLASVDLGKAIISSDDSAIKKAVNILLKRCAAGIIIFFVPTIISFTVSLVTGSSELDKFADCSKCISNPGSCVIPKDGGVFDDCVDNPAAPGCSASKDESKPSGSPSGSKDDDSIPEKNEIVTPSVPETDKKPVNSWGVNTAIMPAGVYGSPIALNDRNKMVDKNNRIIGYGYTHKQRVPDGKGGTKFHRGIDLTASGNDDRGTNIYTLGPGVVVHAYKTAIEGNKKTNNGYGNCVKVLHEVIDGEGNPSYVLSMYQHLNSVPDDINVGSVIKGGTKIGTLGNTGNSGGAHLHLEVTKVPFLKVEYLAGKDGNEIAKLWIGMDPKYRQQSDGWHYGETNWINMQEYFERQGWIGGF